MSTDAVTYEVNYPVQDLELDELHAAAFGGQPAGTPWSGNLERYSLFWVTAHRDDRLVGFVNVLGDGGAHAILMDTCVAPDMQGRRIGATLVDHAAQEARSRGCEWLHADYEADLVAFYESGCGFRPTAAGLLHLR